MKLLFGLTVALIGMGTVFFALVLLVGVIKVQGYLVSLAERRKAPRVSAAPAAGSAAMAAPAGDEGEVLAVIAAAVSAFSRKP
ncbi:MAG TPA: OadG family protein [Syntrophales bacterium]|nr:OadG family protein [Syntrophales bacterium]